MLDIILIHPGAQHGIFGPLGDNLTAKEPPTWTRMIAGWLRDRGYLVRIIDAEAENLTPLHAALRTAHWTPKVIGIVVSGHQPSASTQQMVGASAIAKALRTCCSRSTVVMLGNHPSALPERTLREEQVTYVIDGEGPISLKALIDDEDPKDIPGLVWRQDDKIIRNPLAPLIPIDELGGDVWDLLPMDKYRAHQWQCFGDLSKRQPYASIYTTLGCPHKCSFCMINTFQHVNKYRMRSPEKVVSQIVHLYEHYGVRTIKIADEMFVLNERHYTAICEGLVEAKAAGHLPDDLNIWAYARVDTVKPHTLEMFRKAGIRWLALGIESGSKHVRDGSDKALRNEDIVGVVRAIQAAGINVIGNFIVGLPDDSMETMEETYQLAAELNCEFMNVYSAHAYPGSKLYDEALEKGWTLPKTWSGFSQHNADCRPLDTQFVTGKQVLAFRDEFFRRYYSRLEYIDMIRAKFGEATVDHINGMLRYKLTRKLLTGEIS